MMKRKGKNERNRRVYRGFQNDPKYSGGPERFSRVFRMSTDQRLVFAREKKAFYAIGSKMAVQFPFYSIHFFIVLMSLAIGYWEMMKRVEFVLYVYFFCVCVGGEGGFVN